MRNTRLAFVAASVAAAAVLASGCEVTNEANDFRDDAKDAGFVEVEKPSTNSFLRGRPLDGEATVGKCRVLLRQFEEGTWQVAAIGFDSKDPETIDPPIKDSPTAAKLLELQPKCK